MSKRKTTRSWLPFPCRTGCGFILFIIVATLGLIGILVFAFTNVLDPVGQQGNAFMTALKNEQYDAAYAMMSDEFQETEPQNQFASRLKEQTNPPSAWSFSSFSVNGPTGRIKGRATFDEQEYNLTIYFVYEDGGWAVNGFDFGPYQETNLVPTPAPTVEPSH